MSCDGKVLIQGCCFLGRGVRDLWESVVVMLHHFIIRRRECNNKITEYGAMVKLFPKMFSKEKFLKRI